MRKETPENTDVQDKLRCFWNKTHTHIHTQPERERGREGEQDYARGDKASFKKNTKSLP